MTTQPVSTTLNALFTSYENELFVKVAPKYLTLPTDPLAIVIQHQTGSLTNTTDRWPYADDDLTGLLRSLNNKLDDLISNESITLAQTIRDFYKQKYAYTMFMGEEVSPFQRSLMGFLTQSNMNELKEDDLGMLMSLPRMYQEDLEIIEMMGNFESFPEPIPGPQKDDYVRRPLILFSKRKSKMANKGRHDYWFMDNKSQLYRLMLPTYTMESVFMDKALLLNDNRIDFEGRIFIRKLYHNNFYYAHIVGRYDI